MDGARLGEQEGLLKTIDTGVIAPTYVLTMRSSWRLRSIRRLKRRRLLQQSKQIRRVKY